MLAKPIIPKVQQFKCELIMLKKLVKSINQRLGVNIKVGRQVEAMTMLTKYLVPLRTANPFCRWAEHHSLVLASGLFFLGYVTLGFR